MLLARKRMKKSEGKGIEGEFSLRLGGDYHSPGIEAAHCSIAEKKGVSGGLRK